MDAGVSPQSLIEKYMTTHASVHQPRVVHYIHMTIKMGSDGYKSEHTESRHVLRCLYHKTCTLYYAIETEYSLIVFIELTVLSYKWRNHSYSDDETWKWSFSVMRISVMICLVLKLFIHVKGFVVTKHTLNRIYANTAQQILATLKPNEGDELIFIESLCTVRYLS